MSWISKINLSEWSALTANCSCHGILIAADRTGICICMDIAISAYYFCILKILCTLYWIYSQYSDKCWTCNRVIQDCCLIYFLWSLLGRVKQTYYLLLHLSRHLLKPFILWGHGGSSVKTQKHTKGWYNLSFSSSAWSRKQITRGTWRSCLSLKLWK